MKALISGWLGWCGLLLMFLNFVLYSSPMVAQHNTGLHLLTLLRPSSCIRTLLIGALTNCQNRQNLRFIFPPSCALLPQYTKPAAPQIRTAATALIRPAGRALTQIAHPDWLGTLKAAVGALTHLQFRVSLFPQRLHHTVKLPTTTSASAFEKVAKGISTVLDPKMGYAVNKELAFVPFLNEKRNM
jgi:hypothetical protein